MTKDTRVYWLGPDVGKFDFACIHLQMADDDRIGLTEIGVFFLLAKHADTETGECYPSGRRLAKQGIAHRDTIRKAIDTLESAGYLYVVHGKARRVNRYFLLAPPSLPNGLSDVPIEEVLEANGPESTHLWPKSDAANGPKRGQELEPETRSKEQAISDSLRWDDGVDKSLGRSELADMKKKLGRG